MHRVAADLLALGVGAGWAWFAAVGLRKIVPALRPDSLAGIITIIVVWCMSGPVAAQLRDALLRRWGVDLPPARTPRNWRVVLAWSGGFVAACLPFALAWSLARVLGETGVAATNAAGVFALFVAPTVGVLATRGLCRRWSAPPASSPPAAAAAPAPVPTPLPARPADEPPGPRFLPAPA